MLSGRFVWLFACFLLSWLPWCDILLADGPAGAHFLFAGKSVMTDHKGLPGMEFVPPESHFLVAVTPERMVVGWTYNHELPEDKLEPHHRFHYLNEYLETPLGIDCTAISAKSLLDTKGRKLQSLERQPSLDASSSSARYRAMEVGPIANFSMAVMFSSVKFGVSPNDILELWRQGDGTNEKTGPFGTLTVEGDAGVRRISIEKNRDDLLSPLQPSAKLRSLRSPLFGEGLESVFVECIFAPPLSPPEAQTWSAKQRVVQAGIAGELTRMEYDVFVDYTEFDIDVVNREIDRVISIIPEGERVVTGEKVAYHWEDGKIERSIDPSALAAAAELNFGKMTGLLRGAVFFSAVIFALGFAYLVVQFAEKKPARAEKDGDASSERRQ